MVGGLPANDVAGLAALPQTGPDAGISVVAGGHLPYRCPLHESPVPDVVADQIAAVRRDERGRTQICDFSGRSSVGFARPAGMRRACLATLRYQESVVNVATEMGGP